MFQISPPQLLQYSQQKEMVKMVSMSSLQKGCIHHLLTASCWIQTFFTLHCIDNWIAFSRARRQVTSLLLCYAFHKTAEEKILVDTNTYESSKIKS